MINEKLTKILCCPNCGEKNGLIFKENEIVCPKCESHYEIKNNIPVMMLAKVKSQTSEV